MNSQPSSARPIASSTYRVSNADQLIATSSASHIANQAIITKSFTGHFRNLRIRLAGLLTLMFFGLPWLNWNGHQAVLWDLETRKFYIFGATFMPQDLTLLMGILTLAAIGLLAVNLLVGRAWCGYACPQSMWTWAFMWVEKVTEGDRHQRVRLNDARWSLPKLAKRSVKHSAWLAMSVATGIGFIGYFVPVRELTLAMLSADWFSASGFWVMAFAGMTYLNAGWLREQICLHMCPYARLQSVVFDKDTQVVSYDAARGENRGSRKRETDRKATNLGDCIDCQQCVQVCPTGIDIRNGLQMDCIGCGACIDVCDSIMAKMDYPKGLIRYSSENQLAGKPRKLLRPAVFVYAATLLAVVALSGFTLYDRELVGLNIAKDRSLYRLDSKGRVVNVYLLKITNKLQVPQQYRISLEGAEGLSLQRDYQVFAAAGETLNLPISVVKEGAAAVSKQAESKSAESKQAMTTFLIAVKSVDDDSIYLHAKASFTLPKRHE